MKNIYTFKSDEYEQDTAFQKDIIYHVAFKRDDVSWYL